MDKYNGIMEIKNTYGEYETLVLIPINQDEKYINRMPPHRL